ncbi:MAG: hypothetical protein Q7T19_06940 [Caulobacter sp.]|nr:hypothetical protein [Caulobacter sp.]
MSPTTHLVLRRQSLLLGGLTGSIALLVGGMIALVYFILPALHAGRPGYPPVSDLLPGSMIALTFWSPVLFYLAALLAMARMFAQVAAARPVWRATARGLGLTGWALMLGSVMTVLVQPRLMQLDWVREVMVQQGRHAAVGGIAHFDVPAIVIGVVGLAMLLLGGLLRRAEAVEAELEDFV